MTDEEKHMTRREYREQQEQEARQFQADRDQGSEPDEPETDSFVEDGQKTREEQLNEDHELAEAHKTSLLKKKLNLIIAGLMAVIIVVYLILFFVG